MSEEGHSTHRSPAHLSVSCAKHRQRVNFEWGMGDSSAPRAAIGRATDSKEQRPPRLVGRTPAWGRTQKICERVYCFFCFFRELNFFAIRSVLQSNKETKKWYVRSGYYRNAFIGTSGRFFGELNAQMWKVLFGIKAENFRLECMWSESFWLKS